MQFTESAVVVSEDSAVATVCVNLTDLLDGLERDVLVDFTTAPGTAGIHMAKLFGNIHVHVVSESDVI